MGDYAIVDGSRAPIVHVQVVGEPNDDSFEEYLSDVGAMFRELDRFGMVFNTGHLGQLPPRFRDRLAQWLKETESEFKGRWLAASFVIKSRVIRGVLMTVFWLNPPYYKVHVAATEEEAWSWVRQRLSDSGVSLDPPATEAGA